MSKRELGAISNGAAVDVDAPRAKRHRAGTASSPPEEEAGGELIDVVKTEDEEQQQAVSVGGDTEKDEEVKEQGLKLWQTVKDAVNKEGRTLSHSFLQLPSKRQYPDYYQLIKRPIALKNIKSQLDSGQYESLEDVKQDLEQCFANAKKYNMRESQIWKDAKHLHKLVKKEYAKMTGQEEEEAHDDAHGEGGEGEGEKRQKVPNLYRQMKAKMQKLVSKTDENGRVLSTEFMELPSKKLWPEYYKVIKKPMCFEFIFKKVKRKEYTNSADFAADVELVFDNALEFNADHTPIWEDAVSLRTFFAKLMSELPAEFALPQYAPAPKIKLKPSIPATPLAPIQQADNSGQAPLVRLPGGQGIPNTAAITIPAAYPTIAPAVAPSSSTSLPVMANRGPSASAAPPPQYAASTSTYPHYYPSNYQPLLAAASSPVVTNGATASPAVPPAVSESSGSSTDSSQRLLRSVSLITQPHGRRLRLQHREGVSSWVLRLAHTEKNVSVEDVLFSGPEEHASDDEDEGGGMGNGVEEYEEDAPMSQKKGKSRGPGRPPKRKPKDSSSDAPKTPIKVKTQNGVKVPVKDPPMPSPEDILVKLNGNQLNASEGDLTWHTEVSAGANVLEVGEKGGNTWKVYLFA